MTRHRTVLAATAACLPAIAVAAPVQGPYVSVGAGVDFQQNESLSAIPGIEPQRSLRFDLPGLVGTASFGWGLGNGLHVEVEGDYFNDHIGHETYPDSPRRVGGYQQTYGGMVNALYDIPISLPITPYVGVGVGGQVVEVDGLNSSLPGRIVPSGGAQFTSGFAYQAIVGLAYDLPTVPGLALTAEYRFLGLADPLPAIQTHVFNAESLRSVGVFDERIGNLLHHSILFGARYAFSAAPPPPPPTPAPVVAPAPASARTYLVFFDWDAPYLTPRAREIVAEAAQNSTRVQTTQIEVNGYADTSHALPGRRGQEYNLRLSIRRADSVRAELVRDGVPPGAIEVHGYGDTHLLMPTGRDVREPQNHRVEIILH